MKKYILLCVFPVCVVLLISCHKSKPEIVNDFIDAKNSYDTEKMSQYLTDDFMYYYGDTVRINDRSEYLDKAVWGNYKINEHKTTLLKIQDLDSVIKTEEIVSTLTDSLLGVNPKIVFKTTYMFSGDKLKSITVDSILNLEEYQKSYNENFIPFAFYMQDKYDIQDETEPTIENIIKYLKEYVALPISERKEYSTYAHLQGAFTSNDCHLYKALIFRGKKTVTIIDGFFGFPFATSYEIDENYIRIRTDKSDLLFEIKDNKTLIGEGFASGTFTKSN